MPLNAEQFITDGVVLLEGVDAAIEQGYGFAPNVIHPELCSGLVVEAGRLPLLLDDRADNPVNAGTQREIAYKYKNAHFAVHDPTVPLASRFSHELGKRVMMRRVRPGLKALHGWMPNAVGYQQYEDPSHHLDPHRDSNGDIMLRATATLQGSAVVQIYEADPEDINYKDTTVIDEFTAEPGDVMFLRAPGLGNDERTIHGVLPPSVYPRLILNICMVSPEVLKAQT